MQSRLIGTDAGLNMIAEASNSVSKTAVEGAEAARNTTTDFLTQSQQRAKQLLDLQSQLEATKAQKQSGGGLAAVADSVGKLLIQREQDKAKAAQQKEQQNLVLKGTRLKAAIGNNEQRLLQERKQAEADAKVKQAEDDDQQLLLYGDVEARLTTARLQEPGVERYRSVGSKIISDAIGQGLRPENVVKLMTKINETTVTDYQKRGQRIDEEAQKLSDTRADQASAILQFKITPVLSRLRNLPPTEQAAPVIAEAEALIKATLADNSLTPEQKYRISSAAINQVTSSFGAKADAYFKQSSALNQMTGYIGFMRQARAEFEADGNLDKYKGKLTYAKEFYGDFENAIAQPGEAEKFTAQQLTDINTRQRIIQEGQERLGANLNITTDESSMLAKRMVSNPAFLAQMEKSPEFGNNPSVRAAVTLAKRYQAYVKDKADLEDWKATNGVTYAKLNLNIASNRAQLIERMARAKAALDSGKELTPEQKAEADFTQRTLQQLPELKGFIDGIAQKINSGGKIDVGELTKASNIEEQGLIGVMKAVVQEQQNKEEQLRNRYFDLQQYGMQKPVDQITKDANSEQKALDIKMENWSNLIRQQQTQQQTPVQYGQQAPFDSSSTYGAEVDERGLVKLAPRQRLNTITVNGTKVVTPVVSGSGAPLTSQWKASRDGGRRQHAGIDFGQNAGVPSVALVGGQVAHVEVHSSGYGGFMDIIGDNGYVYRYAHQGGFKFKPGQRVKAGDLVSVSDGSGAGPPHLHFEVHAKPTYSNGKYVPQYGVSATIDPIEHLSKLSAKDSSVLMPRMNNRQTSRMNPRAKVANNAAVLPQGGALQANTVQFVGGQTRAAANVYNNQRPIRNGKLPWNIGNPNSISYDYDDDFGYAPLRNNTKLRRAITDAAKELKVPAVWIADIIRQESGAAMSHKTVHNGGRNYGLFGFGNDSFRDVKVAQMRNMDESQQLKLMTRYMRDNGWLKHLAKRGGETSISEFWAIMRMGTDWRNRVLKDPVSFLSQRMNDTGRTWADELGLLGKWTGRSYSIPGRNSDRRSRNAAIKSEEHASCQLCQQMLVSGSSILPHAHDIG